MKVSQYGKFQESFFKCSSQKPSVTSAAEDEFISSLRNRLLTAPQIAAQINASQSSSNRHISTSTVQMRLRESGLHGRITAKKPLLKDTNKKKRLYFVSIFYFVSTPFSPQFLGIQLVVTVLSHCCNSRTDWGEAKGESCASS